MANEMPEPTPVQPAPESALAGPPTSDERTMALLSHLGAILLGFPDGSLRTLQFIPQNDGTIQVVRSYNGTFTTIAGVSQPNPATCPGTPQTGRHPSTG